MKEKDIGRVYHLSKMRGLLQEQEGLANDMLDEGKGHLKVVFCINDVEKECIVDTDKLLPFICNFIEKELSIVETELVELGVELEED